MFAESKLMSSPKPWVLSFSLYNRKQEEQKTGTEELQNSINKSIIRRVSL